MMSVLDGASEASEKAEIVLGSSFKARTRSARLFEEASGGKVSLTHLYLFQHLPNLS
jgi:hypothetical protein